MRVLLIIFSLFFAFLFESNSQNQKEYENVNEILRNYISQLKDSGVDTILAYQEVCLGSSGSIDVMLADTCYQYGENFTFTYCFWKKNGETNVSRIDKESCYKFDTIEYSFDKIWEYYFLNQHDIANENLRAEYFYNGDTLEYWVDHYCLNEIVFVTPVDTLSFELSEYYFEKYLFNNMENINYLDNCNTLRKKLQQLIRKELDLIEKQKLIEKAKYKHVVKEH